MPSIVDEYSNEWIQLCAVGISAQDVPHTAVFLAVPPVEGEAIVPPVVVKPFRLHKELVLARVELNELAVEGTARRCNAHTGGPQINSRNSDPGWSNVPPWLLYIQLARHEVPSNPRIKRFEVVDERKVDDKYRETT